MTQSEFAKICGVVQASVSRWENGVPPSLDDMQAIRTAARERGIDWDDRLFFEAPISGASEPPITGAQP